MTTAKMTSKGQITIPVKVRLAMRLKSGDRVEFVAAEDGVFVIRPANLSIQRLKGLIPKPKRPVSIDDMNEAISRRGAHSE